MKQLPGSRLRILGVEMSKKGGVGEMLQTGGVICHGVQFAREVGGNGAIPMALLKAAV